jgi:aryl-alcohol dehydrogenase-like predicted oxidoreductase
MKQVPLGKTGTHVSVLCLGCLPFGTITEEETAYQLADHYFEIGGRFFDTANNYSFWVDGATGDESETVLGRWMKGRKNRDQIFLATKVGARPAFPGGGFENREGLSAQAIEKAIEGSLARLGTDYIDLYYAHIDDRQTSLEETLATFDRLVKAGKVRSIGCSNIATWRIEQARNISHTNGWTQYCCVQQRYTYLRPKPGADFGIQAYMNDDLLDYGKVHNDFSLLAYSPLLSGSYTRKDVPRPDQYVGPDAEARMSALTTVAKEVGATLNQVVLAWMIQGTPAIMPLIAASTGKQLDENLGALSVHLTQEHIAFLNTTVG